MAKMKVRVNKMADASTACNCLGDFAYQEKISQGTTCSRNKIKLTLLGKRAGENMAAVEDEAWSD